MTSGPMLKQVMIASASLMVALSIGASLSFPPVLMQQFKSNESTIHPDMDTATWITSMHGFAGIPSLLMPSIMQWKGRKFSFAASALIFSIGLILTATATSAKTLIVTEGISGLGCNSLIIVNLLTISEMLAPEYRTIVMTSISLIQILGISVGSLIGTLIYWKTLALLISAPVIMALSTIWFWPESPSWLAYKNRFQECEEAFINLRGTDEHSLKELKTVIAAQKEYKPKVSRNTRFKKVYSDMLRKDFYKPNALILLVLMTYYLSGGASWFMYAFSILEQVTGDAYLAQIGYLTMNICYLIFPLLALFLVRRFNSKTTILCAGFACVASNFCSFIIVYLQSINILEKGSLFFMFSFIGYFVCLCSGYNVVTFAMCLELIPVRHKGLGGALYIIYACSLHAMTVKILPFLNLYTEIWGTFLMCAVIGIIGLSLMWVYIPDAKNRTLQEIEDYYNFGTFDRERNVDSDDVALTTVNDVLLVKNVA